MIACRLIIIVIMAKPLLFVTCLLMLIKTGNDFVTSKSPINLKYLVLKFGSKGKCLYGRTALLKVALWIINLFL